MKTRILQLILSAYAAARGPSGTITDDGTVQTITKTIYHTTMQRHESSYARGREAVTLPTMASAFPWPVPGIKSRRNNEAGATRLAETVQTPPFPRSSRIRQHDETPRFSMATVFNWPSAGTKSKSTIVANGINPVRMMITPTHEIPGLNPRVMKGHKPTVSQISTAGVHLLVKKPTSRFSHRAIVLPTNPLDRRETDLFNLKLTLPRSASYISVFISDNLAAPFCQKIPGETREDENDSKLDGSRRFYDLELGIGVGLTKIPVREDYAVKFCRIVKGGHGGLRTHDKEEASAKKTTAAPKSKSKTTNAATTGGIATSLEASTTPAVNPKPSPVKFASEDANIANAKAKSTATVTTGEGSERSKTSGATSMEGKPLPTESLIEGLTMSKARAKTTAAANTDDASDFDSSKPTMDSLAKAKSSHVESPTGDVDQTKTKAAATEAISSGAISDTPMTTKPTPTKAKSSYIDHPTEALTIINTTAMPTATDLPDGKSDAPVSTKSKPLNLESTIATATKTQDATKSNTPVQTGVKSLTTKSLDGETSIATRTRPLSSQPSNLAPQDVTLLDEAVPTVFTKQPTNSTPIDTSQSDGEIEAKPDGGKRPLAGAESSDSRTKPASISNTGISSSVVKATASKLTADIELISSTQAVKEGSKSTETSLKRTKSISSAIDSPSKTTEPASIQAQGVRPGAEAPSLTVPSINSWYDSINGYLRTVHPIEGDTPIARNGPITYPTATLRTPTASMTTMPSVKRRDDEPLLTVASMNSWYNSINDYLKTTTANDAAAKVMTPHPSSNAAVKRTKFFGLWERAKPVGNPPAVVVRREEDQTEADEEGDSNFEKVEEPEVVHTPDEELDVAEEEQMPLPEESPVEEGVGVLEAEIEDVAELEATPDEETSEPEADPPAEDAHSSPEETDIEVPKPTAPAKEDLPPLELLSTDQPTAVTTPDTTKEHGEEGEAELTTKLLPTTAKNPEATMTNENEETVSLSASEPGAEANTEDMAEESSDTKSNETATGIETTMATKSTPSQTLIWGPSCTAPAPLDPSSAPPAPPDDADDTSFPPLSTPVAESPHSPSLPDKSKIKGCWTLVALSSTSNTTAHDSLSTAWGTIKDKEIVWTVMFGWAMLGLEIIMGGWEFMRGVRGDAEVGQRIVGLWVRR